MNQYYVKVIMLTVAHEVMIKYFITSFHEKGCYNVMWDKRGLCLKTK